MSVKKNSELTLDVVLAAELKAGFRRNGWTTSMIKELSKGNTLAEVLDFLSENKNALNEINFKKKKSKKEQCTCDAKVLDSQSEEASEDLILMHQELQQNIKNALSKLNVVQYGIACLFLGIENEKLSIMEIAKLYRITKKEVLTHKEIALSHLRQSLKEYKDPLKVCCA